MNWSTPAVVSSCTSCHDAMRLYSPYLPYRNGLPSRMSIDRRMMGYPKPGGECRSA